MPYNTIIAVPLCSRTDGLLRIRIGDRASAEYRTATLGRYKTNRDCRFSRWSFLRTSGNVSNAALAMLVAR